MNKPAIQHPCQGTSSEQSLLRSFSSIRRNSYQRESHRSHRRDPTTGIVPAPYMPLVPVRAASSLVSDEVAASPFPEPPFRDASVGPQHPHQGIRRDYQLGDALRDPTHALVATSLAAADRAAASLRVHDFAFVKRSDGSFSYAILAYRSTEEKHKGNPDSTVDCLNFVMSDIGATKKVSRRHWGRCVRLVSMERVPTKDQFPIPVISFVSNGGDEECSVISNVSERCRAQRR